jgi:hypothetical protein
MGFAGQGRRKLITKCVACVGINKAQTREGANALQESKAVRRVHESAS